jgi:hypothetical protein
MTDLARTQHLHHRVDGRSVGSRALFALSAVAMAGLAVASIVYLLQPQWAEAPPLDPLPLPIVVADVVFNVPAAAIRVPMQRRAGPQERIDLAYQWPQLTPAATPAAGPTGPAVPGPELFVTIERSQGLLPPGERLKSIYPRYFDEAPRADPIGLMIRPFGDGTPYQGEDVLYDQAAPERFMVRCSRAQNQFVWATCIDERTVGSAALTFRFPRAWLTDWRDVNAGIDRLIEGWRPTGR